MSDASLSIHTSTTSDGNMSFVWGDRDEVLKHRRLFFAAHNVRERDAVVMSVEHGDRIVQVNQRTERGIEGGGVLCDALVAEGADTVLFLLTADCYPCILFDPVTRTRALLHLGWRPTHMRLPEKVSMYFSQKLYIPLSRVHVWFGPGISANSYIVDNPEQLADTRWLPFINAVDSRFSVDVQGYACAQFTSVGIMPTHITMSAIDTKTSPTYFSHSRDRGTEREGRFATVVSCLSA